VKKHLPAPGSNLGIEGGAGGGVGANGGATKIMGKYVKKEDLLCSALRTTVGKKKGKKKMKVRERGVKIRNNVTHGWGMGGCGH